jgi:putative addiction module component (TIGR02574 family)
MSLTKEQILDAAKELSLDDRMDLVDGLIASASPEEQREIDRLWSEEIGRRIDALERGDATVVPLDEAIEQLRVKSVK